MYLISLYFDHKTDDIINKHINDISKITHNMFMIDHQVPAHLTLLAFDCKKEDEVIHTLQQYFKDITQFPIDFMSAGYFPSVLYLSPILNYNLQHHLINIYNILKNIDTISFSNKYLPYQYMPHTTLAKTLTKEQLIKGNEYLIHHFTPIKGSIHKIALSKTNPYTDLLIYNIKEHQLK